MPKIPFAKAKPKTKEVEPLTWLYVPDTHHPETDKRTLAALLDFMDHKQVDGFIFGGDQFSNNEISHWNKKKIIFRERGSYKKNTETFDKIILTPVEQRLKKGAKKIWIQGNHERFETDLVEENPEMEGSVEHHKLLNLEARGWEIVGLGEIYKVGKLKVIHGEGLTGIGNQAGAFPTKKAVESYAGSVLHGHVHTLQAYTKVLPYDQTQKWAAYSSPVLSTQNAGYARNKPNNVVNGFTIVEQHGELFNIYPVVVSNGRFAYAGKIYGSKKKAS